MDNVKNQYEHLSYDELEQITGSFNKTAYEAGEFVGGSAHVIIDVDVEDINDVIEKQNEGKSCV